MILSMCSLASSVFSSCLGELPEDRVSQSDSVNKEIRTTSKVVKNYVYTIR